MNRSLWLLGALLTLTAALVIGCGGGGGGGSDGGPTKGSPEDFARDRDALMGELDAIGANIGAVPDDIREHLLRLCQDLEQYVDPEELETVCSAIDRAIEENDPGLIDLVLNELAALEPD